jgi:hypothetical protein
MHMLTVPRFYAGPVAQFCPTPVRGSVKYGSKGGCPVELFQELNLPQETAKSLAALSNLGVSKATWSTYRTAKVLWVWDTVQVQPPGGVQTVVQYIVPFPATPRT